jgi:4-alpha-glucanotransferase
LLVQPPANSFDDLIEMRNQRSAGILLHITSLPGPYGIGDFGPAAFEFVDYLAKACQSVWQILPLCPTTFGNSPYSSYSAFAGNCNLISPVELVNEGWLEQSDLDAVVAEYGQGLDEPGDQAKFDQAAVLKNRMLEIAFRNFIGRSHQVEQFDEFGKQQAWWLNDFSSYEALREQLNENDWTRWPEHYRQATMPENLQEAMGTAISFSKFKQYLFDQQWRKLKSYANQKGIRICGDMPIFVAHDSSDVWANQSQFLLDSQGRPTVVAGVPPDYFSETGQLWGNPLYDWPAMSENGFRWWVDRFRRALEQFDLLRVDHFRGFSAYWEIPAGAETAVDGNWKMGPREMPFIAAEKALGQLPIWAEDLGEIDQPVHDLRDRLNFPSMRVMQFGFDNEPDDMHRHTTYAENCIGYTGTHDNDTLMGWFGSRREGVSEETTDVLAKYLDGDVDVNFQIIKLLYESPARSAIVPLQDVMGLGTEARMNVPGTASGNWGWRYQSADLSAAAAEKLQVLVIATGRLQSLVMQSA